MLRPTPHGPAPRAAVLAAATLTTLLLFVVPPARADALALAPPRAGTFCRSVDAGRIELAADGKQLRCERTDVDPRLRWRVVK